MEREPRARAIAAILLMVWIAMAAVHGPGSRPQAPARSTRPKLDLNDAPHDALALLPGVGSRRAREIVRRRAKRPFESLIELEEIHGIGPTTRMALTPYAMVGGVVLSEPTR